MSAIQHPAFSVMGICVRTCNADQQAQRDLGALWQRFFAEQIAERIPGALAPDLYAVYYDYEHDHQAPYTTLIGVAVPAATVPANGLTRVDIPAQHYQAHPTIGEMPQAVIQAWQQIWAQDAAIPRAYGYAFVHYPAQAQTSVYLSVTP